MVPPRCKNEGRSCTSNCNCSCSYSCNHEMHACLEEVENHRTMAKIRTLHH